MGQAIRVLNIEDSEDDAALLKRMLKQGGYDPIFERVDTSEMMQAALERQPWDVILSDFSLPQFDARAALEVLHASKLDVPFIIISGSIGEDIAVSAMKAGANDYIMKDNPARLIPAIERELREAEARRQHRQLEQQLLQAQKMESIGRLAGGIAHDFNNLLTAIIGYTELAEEELPHDSTVKDSLNNVLEAAQRAAALTHQLLAFARKQIIEPRIIDLNALLQDFEKILKRLIGEDVELVTQLAPDLGAVRVDPGQFDQVLLNLAVNARDAMPDGGRLILETANMILDEEYVRHHFDVAPGEYVMLAVSDTGIGMDAPTQERIFEPFFTTKDVGKGTGLGLSTCYGIIKQSGGDIWLYSELGKGTVFKIYLPRVGDASSLAPTLPAGALPQGTETVLLVEDEPQVRAVEAHTLRARGYQVIEAGNGIEAQQIVRDWDAEIHLLVSDVVMPQMGGKDLAEWIRTVYPEIRVLLTSGYTNTTMIHDSTSDSEFVFLQKPFSPRELARKVQEILQG